MGLLDIVDENDKIIGEADFLEAHEKGLRHRSVQLFVFWSDDYLDFDPNEGMRKSSKLLVSRLSKNRQTARLKLSSSAGGHVKKGQSYEEAAYEECEEELFHGIKMPKQLELNQVCSFVNDSNDGWRDNRENSQLFATNYRGRFSFSPDETDGLFWEHSHYIYRDMQRNPDKYTSTFINTMEHYLFMK